MAIDENTKNFIQALRTEDDEYEIQKEKDELAQNLLIEVLMEASQSGKANIFCTLKKRVVNLSPKIIIAMATSKNNPDC